MDELTADQVIKLLGMQKHPEGGHYVETFRDTPADGSRGSCTAIYYLLQADEFSAWHRVDAVEIWHWYAGGPLALTISPNGHDAYATHLGPALGHGQKPQVVVPAGLGRRRSRSANGRWSAAPCRRPLSSPGSNWLHPTGGPCRDRPAEVYPRKLSPWPSRYWLRSATTRSGGKRTVTVVPTLRVLSRSPPCNCIRERHSGRPSPDPS
jgi:uncharacterized protein